MKRFSGLVLLLLSLTPLLEAEEEHRRPWGVVPLPIIAYSPDFGGMFGAAAIFFYGPDVGLSEEERQGLRNNTVALNSIITTNGSFIGAVATTNYFASEALRWDNTLSGNRIPRAFFGIGPGAEDEEQFSALSLGGQTNLNLQAAEDLFLGPLYQFEAVSIEERERGGALDSGEILGSEDDLLVSGGGVRLIYDTTGGVFWPTRGYVFDADIRYFLESLGSSYSFGLYGADLRRYFNLFSDHVLALQGRYYSSWGDVPFQFLPSVGGDGPKRGVLEERYRAESALTAQIEYRLPLNRRFALVGFFSGGQVGETLVDVDILDPVLAGGLGFRIALNTEQRLNLRIDIAYAESGISPYVNVREAF
ncbi:MAG: BamA/TamA family outer membrane protein [Spirochaetaceae bacterium]